MGDRGFLELFVSIFSGESESQELSPPETLRNLSKWNRHRLFYTLRQGEIFLKLKYVLSTKTMLHIFDRTLFGFPPSQILYKIKRIDTNA